MFSRKPIGSGRKMRPSISRGGLGMIGAKSICARMSRSRSTPGAISTSSRPSSPRENTQRSVM